MSPHLFPLDAIMQNSLIYCLAFVKPNVPLGRHNNGLFMEKIKQLDTARGFKIMEFIAFPKIPFRVVHPTKKFSLPMAFELEVSFAILGTCVSVNCFTHTTSHY